jgi:hypothetical protein
MTSDAIISEAMSEVDATPVVETDNQTEASESEATELKSDENKEGQEVDSQEGAKEPESEDNQEVEGDSDDADEDSDIPNQVKKALRKKDRYNRNLKERLRSAEARIQELEGSEIKPEAIDENNFDGTYAELIQTRAIEEAKALVGQNQQEQEIARLNSEKQAIVQEQMNVVSSEVNDLASQSKDFAETIGHKIQEFDTLPEDIQGMFFELDSAPLAAYALAKEGRIDDLKYMSPQMAAAQLIAAQERGRQYYDKTVAPKTKKTTSAPAPVEGGQKSRAKSTKSVHDMSPEDLVNRYIK